MNETRAIDCEEALRYLFDFLDAELHLETRHAIAHHLERCRDCFSRFEFEKRLKGHIAALGSEVVPSELRQRIRGVLDDFES